MPLGSEKVGLFGAAGGGAASANYMGDGSLGACTFGASSITQTGDSTTIDDVLTTGSESGGPGTSSYGHGDGTDTVNLPRDYDAAYELTVLNPESTYDGDCVVANFGDLTIDADVLLTTNRPCRGLFLYVDGDLSVAGTLSMSCRGGHSDPTSTTSSDGNAVETDGIQLGLITDGGSSSFTNDGTGFNGAGNAVRTAVANQDDLSSDGTILTVSKTGGAGANGVGVAVGNDGGDGTTGGVTLSTGGGGSGSAKNGGATGNGGTGGAFSGGAGSGGAYKQPGSPGPGTTGNAGNYGGAGSPGLDQHNTAGESGAGGAGNPGANGSRGGTNGQGGSGVGGMMWIVCSGDVTVDSGGEISCDGTNGGGAAGAGGGAGGGTLFIAHFGDYTNNGTVRAAQGTGAGNPKGGDGGNGGVYTIAIL